MRCTPEVVLPDLARALCEERRWNDWLPRHLDWYLYVDPAEERNVVLTADGYPIREATHIALKTTRDFLEQNDSVSSIPATLS